MNELEEFEFIYCSTLEYTESSASPVGWIFVHNDRKDYHLQIRRAASIVSSGDTEKEGWTLHALLLEGVSRVQGRSHFGYTMGMKQENVPVRWISDERYERGMKYIYERSLE